MQCSDKIQSINRQFCIGDGYTEPYHPQQNPAELNAVKWLKTHTQVILDRSGAPEYAWLECAKWLADIHNVVTDESLGWRTPMERRHGITPDISAYIMFSFWEPVYYLEPSTPHPHSKELPARFLGLWRRPHL